MMDLAAEIREWSRAFDVPADVLREAARLGASDTGARIGPQLDMAIALAQSGKAEAAAAVLLRVVAQLPGYEATNPVVAAVYRSAVEQR